MKAFFFNCVQLERKGLTGLYAKLISLTNKHCFSSHIYGTPNSAAQSKTFGVALIFTYSVVLQLCVYI